MRGPAILVWRWSLSEWKSCMWNVIYTKYSLTLRKVILNGGIIIGMSTTQRRHIELLWDWKGTGMKFSCQIVTGGSTLAEVENRYNQYVTSCEYNWMPLKMKLNMWNTNQCVMCHKCKKGNWRMFWLCLSETKMMDCWVRKRVRNSWCSD